MRQANVTPRMDQDSGRGSAIRLAQAHYEIENSLDRVVITRVYRCRPVCDLAGEPDEFRQAKSHETYVFKSEITCSLLEQFGCSPGVPLHAPRVLLAGLHPRRSQFDQPLQKPAGAASAAACEPQPFPTLVGLPVVAVIEQIDAVQVRSADLPPIWFEKFSRWGVGTKAMTPGVAERMREAPGNKRVRRQRLIGGESWDFAFWSGSMQA